MSLDISSEMMNVALRKVSLIIVTDEAHKETKQYLINVFHEFKVK
jgi:hypothetical protein